MANDENLNEVGPDEGAVREKAMDDAPRAGSPKEPDDPGTAASSPVGPGSASGDESSDTLRGREPRAKQDSTLKHTKKRVKEAQERREEKIAQLTEQAGALQAEARDLKDKWLRSAAEFENYRKRTRKEWELLEQRTKAEVILDVLTVVDDFERAFSVAGDRDDDFIRGIRLIYNNLRLSLEKIGVRKIEALQAAFDPAYHMAIAQIERDGADSNHVIEVVQEGYCLGDIVVRPAKVVIAK